MAGRPDIMAAGGIVWRGVPGAEHIGLVVRTRYGGDIGLPKGKLEAGETLRACAVREVEEELGVAVDLGPFAGTMTYPVMYPTGPRDKYVLVWEMQHRADLPGAPDGREIADRLWVSPAEALARLTYQVERDLLAAVLSRRS